MRYDLRNIKRYDARIKTIAQAIERAGGRLLLVGGFVRDTLLGIDSKDLDFEVYGLSIRQLEEMLSGFGNIIQIGRSFGVLRLKGLNADFSLPRKDSKIGSGHRGFDVTCDPHLDFATAAKRRDLTINSMGMDVLTGDLHDPYNGLRDLRNRCLRATSSTHFAEDPLRGLRVAQFAARFDMTPNEELMTLCGQLDLSELSAERVWAELCKLLLKGKRPSVGFTFLEQAKLLRFFPELQNLTTTPQDAKWHPEGDVWQHTLMVVDEAALLRNGHADDHALMLGALCHDLGKPATTVQDDTGRIRSPGHDTAGVPIAHAFLQRLRAPNDLALQVAALVRHHLAPALFIKNGATAKGYRRLARKLHKANCSIELLVRVATADHFGRTTEEAKRRVFPAAVEFLARAHELSIKQTAPTDIVQGRHLIARGLQPGPEFGSILQACRDLQDETGWRDASQILDKILCAVS